MLILCLFLGGHAFADDKKSLGEQVETSLETLKKAGQYSFDNAAIGILIVFGTGMDKDITPESIGDQFVKEINRRGFKARYFYYIDDKEGAAMEYHIGYSAIGPMSVNDAAKRLDEAISMLKAAKNVHGDWAFKE